MCEFAVKEGKFWECPKGLSQRSTRKKELKCNSAQEAICGNEINQEINNNYMHRPASRVHGSRPLRVKHPSDVSETMHSEKP